MSIPEVTRMICTRIPTEYGNFQLCFYTNTLDSKEHLAFFMGHLASAESVLVRVHSECFAGDVMGSRRCDCGEQLDRSMAMVARAAIGGVRYMRQEGPGIGLLEKLRAYNLQNQGFDTVDADLILGREADERDYTLAALMLENLELTSVRLVTNNTAKIIALEAAGITVSERVSLEVAANTDSADYLLTKAQRMDHFLPLTPANSQ
ncbi:MAG: GTP cyclohydrolase II [Halieaceae bacterium]|jgi:GTP cyclohydrolase II